MTFYRKSSLTFRGISITMIKSVGIYLLSLIFILGGAVEARELPTNQPTYQVPPDNLKQIAETPLSPGLRLSPDRKRVLILESPYLVSLAELAEEESKLAGLRLKSNFGKSRGRYIRKLIVKSIDGSEEKEIKGLPSNPRISHIQWSPDSQRIAFAHTKKDKIELWMADLNSAQAKRLINEPLNATYGLPFYWLPNSKELVCKTVPSSLVKPELDPVPVGPIIKENQPGKKAAARTYQDLLKTPDDKALLEYYLTSQIVKVPLNGWSKNLGKPAMYSRVKPSPDGEFILVERFHRPFSYLVPISRFPRQIMIWKINGEMVKEIADLPLAESIPLGYGSVRVGKRHVNWRDDKSATIYWTETQDGGDVKKDVSIRERVYTLSAPFDSKPSFLVSLKLRFNEIEWSHDNLAVVSEWVWQSRKIRKWIFDPSRPRAKKQLLFDYSWQDRYNVPGSFVSKRTPRGTTILLSDKDKKYLYLIGDGASPEGDRPFLDRLNIKTKEKKRIFHSQAPYYERPAQILDLEKQIYLTRRESQSEPPNYFLREFNKTNLKALTDFPHPTPQLAQVKKELIRYKRADGVELTAKLYLPQGFTPGQNKLPVIMWAYPTEFKSAKAASQVDGSPYRFIRIGWWSPLIWLAQGYAVLDDPTMPIIGEGKKEPNDTYIEQLVSSAKAAVDEVVSRGIADPEKIAIGGHSYGAFMTANLLAHSSLFKTGIARSGAYNRTLTPFGFQAEERTLWEAGDTYIKMSPFMNAHKISQPLLLIHGQADNNSGTYPMQSERFYHALKGLGANVRLVMLPLESHGYRSKESVLHVLWETNQWLEKQLK